jgi:hypothetical protein
MISRYLLEQAFPGQRRLVSEFEEQSQTITDVSEASAATVATTTALNDATVLVLSENTAFNNEYVFKVGTGLRLEVAPGQVTVRLDGGVPLVTGDYHVGFIASGDTTLVLPQVGHIATRAGVETFTNKTLDKPSLIPFGNYVDDAAASAGGVPVGGVYRNGSIVMVRVV